MPGAVALLLAAALAVPFSPAAAGPAGRALPTTNGPLLFGDQLVNADGSHHQIKVSGTTTMAFSPEGSRIAGVTLGNVVRIWSADGSSRDLATLPQTVRDLSWAADGSALAALAGADGDHPHSIYVIPLATGVPAVAFTDTTGHRINLENGVSWQPGGSLLLFTADLPLDAGSPNKSINQQLFTVPTTGGAAVQFFVPPAMPTDPYLRFKLPEWGPDGSHVAVRVQEDGTHSGTPYEDNYLSVMTAGVGPAPLRSLSAAHVAAAGPYWSVDGSALLFSDAPAGPGPAPATVIAAAGGAPLGSYAYGGQVTDWQPCPNGTCVEWGLHAPRTLSLDARPTKVQKGHKVKLSGAVAGGGVAVCTSAQQVDVQKAGTGRHATFRHLTTAATDGSGRFSVKVKVRASARYRAVLTGSADCQGATSEAVKVTVKRPKPHK